MKGFVNIFTRFSPSKNNHFYILVSVQIGDGKCCVFIMDLVFVLPVKHINTSGLLFCLLFGIYKMCVRQHQWKLSLEIS